MKFARVYAMFHPMMMFIVGIGVLMVLYMGGVLIIEEHITLGEFVAFSLYLGMLVWPSIALGWVVGIFQQGAASMQRINEMLDTEPDIRDQEDVLPVSELQGNLRIDKLTFRYNNESAPVL